MTCRSQPRPRIVSGQHLDRCGRKYCRSSLTYPGRPASGGRCPMRPPSARFRCRITRPHTMTSSSRLTRTRPGRRPGPPGGRPGAPQSRPPQSRPPRSRPPQSRPPDHDPAADGRGWPGQFAQVLAETLAGSRPHRQIVPWTTEQARKRISRLGPMLAAGDRPVVRRVVASSPAADVVEMTVVVRFGPRVRALAVRLERDGPRSATPGRPARQARWLCTAIEAA